MSFVLFDLSDELIFQILLQLENVQVSAWHMSGVCTRTEALLRGVGGRKLWSTFYAAANRFNAAPRAGAGYADKGARILEHMRVHFARYKVQAVSLRALADAPAGQDIGTTLGLATDLRTLCLANFRCSPRWLGNGLVGLTGLTALELSQNQLIRDSQGDLHLPPSLLTLKMRSCGLRGLRLEGWAGQLGCVTTVDFSRNEFSTDQTNIAAVVAAMAKLCSANLSNMGLQPAVLTAVVGSCARLPGLRNLSVAYNMPNMTWMQDEKTAMMAELARCTALEELSLACLLVNNGAQQLANALRALPALTALDLTHCALGGFSWYVADALTALQALRLCSVSDCRIEQADVPRFGIALAQCPALERVWVSDNAHDFHVPEVHALGARVEYAQQPIAGTVCARFA